MSRRLIRALDASRGELEAGLAEAERELALLHARETELQALIARAKAALGITTSAPTAPRMTLHEAIASVLRERGNDWLTVKEIADEVNHRQLYEKRDGSAVEPNQIHARSKNYSSLFEKEGPRVRLRKGEEEE